MEIVAREVVNREVSQEDELGVEERGEGVEQDGSGEVVGVDDGLAEGLVCVGDGLDHWL